MITSFADLLFDIGAALLCLGLLVALVVGCERTFL